MTKPEAVRMATDWETFSERRKRDWTPAQKRIHEVASLAFEREVDASRGDDD